jgi:hypothetical protein
LKIETPLFEICGILFQVKLRLSGGLPDKFHAFDHYSQLCPACAAKHPCLLLDCILAAFTDVQAAAAREKNVDRNPTKLNAYRKEEP